MDCKQLQQIENRKISVITNFGCRAKCWYCIWKGHRLEYANPHTDWNKLDKFLTEYAYKGKVSLSGGGDCLYKFDQIKSWWDKFLAIVNSKNLKLDIHTREKMMNFKWFEDNVYRVAFSSDHLDIPNFNVSDMTDRQYLTMLARHVKVRIVHLVTKHTSIGMIEDYLKLQETLNCQFTIKHLVNFDDGGMYKIIRKRYPQIFYLDDGDYNIYFMPDNTIETKFIN